MEHTIVKIRSLLESDERLRRLQRRAVATGDEADYTTYFNALRRTYGSYEKWLDFRWKDDYDALKRTFKDEKVGRSMRQPLKHPGRVSMPFFVNPVMPAELKNRHRHLLQVGMLLSYPTEEGIQSGDNEEKASIWHSWWVVKQYRDPLVVKLVTKTIKELAELMHKRGKVVSVKGN